MNDFNDLIRMWQNQSGPAESTIQERIQKARTQAETLAKRVWWRDLREIGSGLSTSAIFLAAGILVGGPVLVGAVIGTLFLVLVTLIILRTRLQQAREDRLPRQSIPEALEYELKAVQRQHWLLRNVTWWYLLPIALAIAAFIAGVQAASPSPDYGFLLIYTILTAALFILIRQWNLSYVRRALDPQVRELEDLLEDLARESRESDGTKNPV